MVIKQQIDKKKELNEAIDREKIEADERRGELGRLQVRIKRLEAKKEKSESLIKECKTKLLAPLTE